MSSSTSEHPTRSSGVGVSANLVAVLMWGTGNVVIAGSHVGGVALAFWRLVVASALYRAFMFVRGRPLGRKELRIAVWGGLWFAGDIFFWFLALQRTTLTHAATIGALQPLGLMLLAGRRFGETVHRRHIGFALAAVAGVVVVVAGSGASGQATVGGDVLAIGAMLTFVGYYVASKDARQHLDVVTYQTALMMVAAVVITPIAVLSGAVGPNGHVGLVLPGWRGLAEILVVVALPGTGHLLVNWAHPRTTIVASSLLTLLMPAVSAIGAAMFLDQPVTGSQWAGMGAVVAAVGALVLVDARQPTVVDELDALEPGPV